MTARPTAAYRLQFREGMTLDRAAALAPYLARLGVSHLYASPIFAATPGSTHGYDVADFNAIDPAIGGMQGLETLSAALQENDLGLILDFVPNHMGATPHNPWWLDVLEWGQESDYREHFDIDWSAPKLVVPVLGEPYGEALRKDLFGFALDDRDGGVSFTYRDLRLPLTPPSYARILARIEAEPFPELARRFAAARPEVSARAKEELAALVRDPAVRPLLDQALAAAAGDQTSLHELHEAQVWRLSYWRAAREGLTYRRFFEIADLVGMRVERPRVFDDIHALLLALIAEGKVNGVRLDHIDGLADPHAYLQRLHEAIGGKEPYYLLVEKILGPDEVIRLSWPAAGTTGYEFMQVLAGLFVDPQGAGAIDAAYASFIGHRADYPTMVRDTKRRILTRNLAGELDFLKDLARGVAERDPSTRDYGPDSLRRAILELVAVLPVYRTYVNVAGPDPADLALIAAAVEQAKLTREVEDEGAIEFVARTLRLDFPNPELQVAALHFATRFQQTTGPVMAKALEDTVFYRFNRLIALNEVGGDPNRLGAPLAAFHRTMSERQAAQPLGLSATATHDTKRGEDARARLYGVGGMPAEWSASVAAWSAMLGVSRIELEGAPAPEPEIEWLFYQALAGAWPAGLAADDEAGLSALAERMQAYMLKAAREAKLRTSWTSPNAAYEDAVRAFVGGALADRRFLADFTTRCAPLWLAGAVTSLSQLAVKLAAPGVPDIYQGTEFWDFNLVDPDNRRPVDFAARQVALAGVGNAAPADLMRDWRSGCVKLRLMQAGLALRRAHPELFAAGEYVPLDVAGDAASHVVAFARRHEDAWLVLAATRLPLPLLDGAEVPLVPTERWGGTRILLPPDARIDMRDSLSGHDHAADEAIAAAAALADFPVALLYGGSGDRPAS